MFLSSAVIAAEIIRFYLPRLVEVHNYVPSHNIKQKTTNWKTLNRKYIGSGGKIVEELYYIKLKDSVLSFSSWTHFIRAFNYFRLYDCIPRQAKC